jgi:hypothetical protein
LGSADFPKDAVLAVMVREGGAINRLTHLRWVSLAPK